MLVKSVLLFTFTVSILLGSRYGDHSPNRHRELFKKRKDKSLNYLSRNKRDRKNEIFKNGYVGETFHTSVNLWHQRKKKGVRSHKTKNQIKGQFLSAGNKVKITAAYKQFIEIEPEKSELTIIIKNDEDESGEGPIGLFYRYFVKVQPKFAKITPKEMKMIKKGEVGPGMSKDAVLIVWGYPPKTDTVTIEKDHWIYYMDKRATRTVVFDNDKVIAVR